MSGPYAVLITCKRLVNEFDRYVDFHGLKREIQCKSLGKRMVISLIMLDSTTYRKFVMKCLLWGCKKCVLSCFEKET